MKRIVLLFFLLGISGVGQSKLDTCNTYRITVPFPLNTSELTKDAQKRLDEIKSLDILMGSWVIEGYANENGKRGSHLSESRANAVFEYLAPTNGNIWVHWYGNTKIKRSIVRVIVRERCY